MIRVIKPEGFGNIQLEDAPIPEINSRQVLVRTERTLISRGSELFRRYISEEALPHSIMGYSLTGTVEKVGAEVTEYQIGQRVMAAAPHAQYVVGDADSTRGHLVPLPDDVSFEAGNVPFAFDRGDGVGGIIRGAGGRYDCCSGSGRCGQLDAADPARI